MLDALRLSESGRKERPTTQEIDLLLDSEEEHTISPVKTYSKRIIWIALGIEFVCFSLFFGALMLFAAHTKARLTDEECTERLSIWSPALAAVKYEEKNFASTFTTDSDFLGPPTPQLEQKWANLSNVPPATIPRSRISALHRDPSQKFVHTSLPNGDTEYVVAIEVFHYLHCLDILRQYAWRDRYRGDLVPWLFQHNRPEVASEHADHCLETLRQSLMCNADITPYLVYEKLEEEGRPRHEDFEATHKCRNWERIRDWAVEHGVNVRHDQ